jgi:hypothetical protein
LATAAAVPTMPNLSDALDAAADKELASGKEFSYTIVGGADTTLSVRMVIIAGRPGSTSIESKCDPAR